MIDFIKIIEVKRYGTSTVNVYTQWLVQLLVKLSWTLSENNICSLRIDLTFREVFKIEGRYACFTEVI